MNIKRITTANTVWEFDLDRMVYIRIPRNESPNHPMRGFGAKPYEGHEVAFHKIQLGTLDPKDGMRHFYVHNTGVEWGKGACTESWALPDQDLTWIETLGETNDRS